MTTEQIQELIVNDPQKLIDDKIVLNFNEVEGDIIVVDGVAAGGPWFGFKFITGLYSDKTIYCAADNIYETYQRASFTYLGHTSDDGMLFNKDPERFDPNKDDDWGGDYVPELNGEVFTIVMRDAVEKLQHMADLEAIEKNEHPNWAVETEDTTNVSRAVRLQAAATAAFKPGAKFFARLLDADFTIIGGPIECEVVELLGGPWSMMFAHIGDADNISFVDIGSENIDGEDRVVINGMSAADAVEEYSKDYRNEYENLFSQISDDYAGMLLVLDPDPLFAMYDILRNQ